MAAAADAPAAFWPGLPFMCGCLIKCACLGCCENTSSGTARPGLQIGAAAAVGAGTWACAQIAAPASAGGGAGRSPPHGQLDCSQHGRVSVSGLTGSEHDGVAHGSMTSCRVVAQSCTPRPSQAPGPSTPSPPLPARPAAVPPAACAAVPPTRVAAPPAWRDWWPRFLEGSCRCGERRAAPCGPRIVWCGRLNVHSS